MTPYASKFIAAYASKLIAAFAKERADAERRIAEREAANAIDRALIAQTERLSMPSGPLPKSGAIAASGEVECAVLAALTRSPLVPQNIEVLEGATNLSRTSIRSALRRLVIRGSIVRDGKTWRAVPTTAISDAFKEVPE